MKGQKKDRIKSIALLLVMAGLAALLIYFAFGKRLPDLLPALRSGNDKEIARYLQGTNKIDGMFSTAMLQFIQVVSIVLPGSPIQVAAGIVYGVWKGFLLCYGGYVLANIVIFLLARRLGGQRVMSLLPEKMQNNWLRQKIKQSDPRFVTILACLIPAIPNGIIPYIGATTDITARDFAVGVCIGSLFPIFTDCAAGQFFLTGDYLKGIVVMVASWLLVFIVYKNQGRLLRSR